MTAPPPRQAQPLIRRAVAGVAAGSAVLLLVALLAAPQFSGPLARGDEQAAPPPGAWTASAIEKRFADPDAAAPVDDFVGSIECFECHDDRKKSLKTSFHAELLKKSSGSRGCEECHGPGREHYDDEEAPIRDPSTAETVESVAVCVRCHVEVLTKPSHGHRHWLTPGGDPVDAEASRTCVTCHMVHIDKSAPAHDPEVGPFRTIRELAKVAEWIPAARCKTCHTDFHPEMARSGHAHLMTGDVGCAACHGPGSLHEESGGDEHKIIVPDHQPARASDAACLACHRASPAKGKRETNTVPRWTCSEHAREGVSCITCHDPNAPKRRTLRAPEFELCGSCHQDVKASFRLRSHHRVKEGRVSCSDCHDPHSNTGRVRDKDVRQRNCETCHQEKGGPFLHDHGIKRSDGCVACHVPHGTMNRRLLTHQRTKPMCLQCHPETPHNLRDRKFNNCLDCHVEIHGSDLDRIFRR